MGNIRLFDLYLWKFPDNNDLIKICRITVDEVEDLGSKWNSLHPLHEYMRVIADSTPFMDEPHVTVHTKEWLEKVERVSYSENVGLTVFFTK